MSLTHRPVADKDIQLICGFPQNEDELFFLFPKAEFPLAPSQLQEAITQRSDSTVVELDGEVVAFANFYRWETGGSCSIGNVIVSPVARGRGVGRYLIEQMARETLIYSRFRRATCARTRVSHGIHKFVALVSGFSPFPGYFARVPPISAYSGRNYPLSSQQSSLDDEQVGQAKQ